MQSGKKYVGLQGGVKETRKALKKLVERLISPPFVTSDNIKATELGDLSGFLGIWPGLAKEERERDSKTRRKEKEMQMLKKIKTRGNKYMSQLEVVITNSQEGSGILFFLGGGDWGE